jgi:hypothetical protein
LMYMVYAYSSEIYIPVKYILCFLIENLKQS